MSDDAPRLRWSDNRPIVCDICGNLIVLSFIDGKTRVGPWAIMCPSCHARIGFGLGTGRGQKYVLDLGDKQFYKTEG